MHRQKCLHHGHGNFVGLKRNHAAVTANDLVVVQSLGWRAMATANATADGCEGGYLVADKTCVLRCLHGHPVMLFCRVLCCLVLWLQPGADFFSRHGLRSLPDIFQVIDAGCKLKFAMASGKPKVAKYLD